MDDNQKNEEINNQPKIITAKTSLGGGSLFNHQKVFSKEELLQIIEALKRLNLIKSDEQEKEGGQ